MEKNYDDIFLARWLNNELTTSELEAFSNSVDYELYKKIASSSSKLEAPEFRKKEVLQKIKENLKKDTPKTKVIPMWVSVAAASVIIMIGIFYFVKFPEKYVTGYGEQLAIKLPDSSEVVINSKSIVTFQKDGWKKNRTLKLKGEAYFKVQKGSTFKVETAEGVVEVLGTEFNVKSTKDFFEIICYEGKVKASTKQHNSILTQGKAFRVLEDTISEKWNVVAKEPMWRKGESSFNSTPLKYVILALKNQFNITFDTAQIDTTIKFTGSFTHKDVNIALQTVFVPMKIGVTFTGEKTVVLEKQ